MSPFTTKFFLACVTLFLLIPSHAISAQEYQPPLGVPEPIIPEDNPVTPEKVALGKKLYFDKRLSADDTVSCATCHDPEKGFADAAPVSTGVGGQKGVRSSPTTLNAANYDIQFWDGRAPSLEEQAKKPLINPVEMGMPSHDEVVNKLRSIKEYQQAFQDAFGEEITIDNIAQAIAAYERTLLSGNSPFDRFMYAGDEKALSDEAKKGLAVFEGKGRCITCHEFVGSYALFTDSKFHNIGVGMDKPDPDMGRYDVTKEEKDRGAFKTPTLREIALTAPYMHDGSEQTLEDVVEFYDGGGTPNPYLSGEIRPLNLTKEEKKALVEFMKSLTSSDIDQLVKSMK
ncbi:MAG: cytochrome-c peroxidase [Planctomycetes bacterium]|nr:cytochrome-c peroxidase [Planctomycetota bacterium]